jgi:hypothetical protein
VLIVVEVLSWLALLRKWCLLLFIQDTLQRLQNIEYMFHLDLALLMLLRKEGEMGLRRMKEQINTSVVGIMGGFSVERVWNCLKKSGELLKNPFII